MLVKPDLEQVGNQGGGTDEDRERQDRSILKHSRKVPLKLPGCGIPLAQLDSTYRSIRQHDYGHDGFEKSACHRVQADHRRTKHESNDKPRNLAVAKDHCPGREYVKRHGFHVVKVWCRPAETKLQ